MGSGPVWRAGARSSVLLVIVIFGVALGMYQLVPPSAVSARPGYPVLPGPATGHVRLI